MFVTLGTEYHVKGPSLRNSGRNSGFRRGFRNKLILPWNDSIPTCVLRNSAENSGFRKMRPGRNLNTKQNAHPSIWVSYAQGPSWSSCALGKSGGGGTCARRGQCQSLGPGVSRQPSRITLPSLSNATTAVSVESTRQHASTKGASPIRECGKLP